MDNLHITWIAEISWMEYDHIRDLFKNRSYTVNGFLIQMLHTNAGWDQADIDQDLADIDHDLIHKLNRQSQGLEIVKEDQT